MKKLIKSLDHFPHIKASFKKGDFYNGLTAISMQDFQNGLDPFEPQIMKSQKLLKSWGDFASPSLFTNYCHQLVFRQSDEKGENLKFILDQIGHYMEAGVFEKKDTLELLSYCNGAKPRIMIDLIHTLLDQKRITLSDKIKLTKSPWGSMAKPVMAPILFCIDSRHAHGFFEKYDASEIKLLSFDVTKSHLKSDVPEAQKDEVVERIDYLSFAERKKDKMLLSLCAEYLGEDKKKREMEAVAQLLSAQTPPKEKLKILKSEIKKHNAQLVNCIDDPTILPILGDAQKDALMLAIEVQHIQLVEKMITMDFFQNRKSRLNAFNECYVGQAASKGGREIEKILMDANFYSLDNFGQVTDRGVKFRNLNEKDQNLAILYYNNTSNLSDESMEKIMKEGLKPNPELLLSYGRKKSYAAYLEKYPDIMMDEKLMIRLRVMIQNIEKMPRPRVIMLLETMAHLERLGQSQDGKLDDVLMNNFEHTSDDFADKIKFVVSAYLKYFPEKKESLMSKLSVFDQQWARSFERKNIDETLKSFLAEMEAPKLQKTPTRRNKI